MNQLINLRGRSKTLIPAPLALSALFIVALIGSAVLALAPASAHQADVENVSDLDPYLRLLDASGSAFPPDGDEGRNAQVRQTLSSDSRKIEAVNHNAGAGVHRLPAAVVGGTLSDSTAIRSLGAGAQTRTLSAGGEHSCGLRETGTVECWGHNGYDQADAPAGRFSAVSAGGYHSCGLRETGAIECWGRNDYSQTDAPAGRFSAVSAGVGHSCGLRETGAVECWGYSGHGRTDALAGRFSAISAGGYHSCGLRETGAVECWGRNDDILGLSSGQADALAGRFSAVSGGGYHSCGLRETGAVECWGDNDDGQTDAPAGRFSAVSAGGYHSCGLRETGAVECWGDNSSGQADALAGRFSAVSAGWWHTCGLRETGAVECWGRNRDGQTDAPAGRFSVPDAQPDPVETAATPIVRGWIVALERDDGRIELGFQPSNGLRILPTRRLLPANVTIGRWYRTSPVEYLGGEIGRVRVRRLENDKVELAFQPTGGEWLYPTKRYLRTGAAQADSGRIRRWLKSSSIEMPLGGACTGDWDDPHVQRYVAQMYAPLLRFDDGENFRPVGIEAMVGNSELLDWTEKLSGERYVPEIVWSWDDTSTMWDITTSNPWTLTADRIAENTNFSLNVEARPFEDLYDDDIYVRWWNTAKHRYDHVVYYRVVETGEHIVIQYWLFYVWNNAHAHGWNHEGDWESVQLVFVPSALRAALCSADAATPIGGGFAQHEYGAWVEWPDIQWFAETHPTVFVAEGSHASYHYGGTSQVRIPALPDLLVHDSHKADAPTLSLAPANLMPAVGSTNEYVLRPLDENWATWPGLWGKREGATKTGHWAPQGPAFKDHYNILPCALEGWDGARQPRRGEAVVSCETTGVAATPP